MFIATLSPNTETQAWPECPSTDGGVADARWNTVFSYGFYRCDEPHDPKQHGKERVYFSLQFRLS